jgi:hydrogenase nickel insertion protein HypA
MHEYSIVQSLLQQVTAAAGERHAQRVKRLSIRVGELSGVDYELLAKAYETFRERTICEGAELVIHRVAAGWSCPRCGESVAASGVPRCAACDAPATLVEGSELFLDRVEMEVPDV